LFGQFQIDDSFRCPVSKWITLLGVRLVSVQQYADFLNEEWRDKDLGVLRVAGQLTERLQQAVIEATLPDLGLQKTFFTLN